MIITGASMLDLEAAATKVHVRLGDYTRQLSANRIQFTLKPTEDRLPDGDHYWQRRSASYFNQDRRVYAVCWHGHGAFMEEVFKRCPDAVIRSAVAVHRGSVLRDSAWKPMGAPIAGGYPRMAEACSCPYSGTDYWGDENHPAYAD